MLGFHPNLTILQIRQTQFGPQRYAYPSSSPGSSPVCKIQPPFHTPAPVNPGAPGAPGLCEHPDAFPYDRPAAVNSHSVVYDTRAPRTGTARRDNSFLLPPVREDASVYIRPADQWRMLGRLIDLTV
ncbi:MAG: hypothetical protein GC164_05040 [Phycisphaera sp.]|nr:hypothetical protein [Phycisphaera sp.]